MGTCGVCQQRIGDDLAFNDNIVISIKERDRLGKVFRSDTVKFKLPLPLLQQAELINLGKMQLKVSGCIATGIDPRAMINKECQDGILYLQKDSVFLAALFDGHGIDGLKVMEFVKEYIKKYFYMNTNAFKVAACESITYMLTDVDKRVRDESSGIDCSISGTTAVILIITDVMHVGSVGDSRGILAALGSYDLDYIPGKRHVDPPRSIFPLRLTLDQKPNIHEELERIKKAGGKIQQLTDEQGNKIGPYRVWKKQGTLPGLAMSRSVGDSIGKEIGVISTPVCNSFKFDSNGDLFIVLASDGIWDVMNDVEVVNFVDKFRNSCKTTSEIMNFPVKVRNK